MRIRNMIYAATAMMLAACTNSDEMPTPGSVALQVNATISDANTRLGFTGTAFEKYTTISIFAEGDEDNEYGYPYTANADTDGTFSPEEETTGYIFHSDEYVKFTAWCPQLSASNAYPVNLSFQHSDLDYLFAKGKASIFAPELKLTFSHVMSKLTFNFSLGDGFTADEFNEASIAVHLVDLPQEGTLNTSTGEVTPGKTGMIRTAFQKIRETDIESKSSSATPAAIAEAIVFPQSEDVTFNLKVTCDGMTYTKRMTTKLSVGNNYVYPVALTKQAMTIGSVTIADWDNVTSDDQIGMNYQPPIKTITDKADVRPICAF